jgi:serine/threonine protein kinase
MGERTDFDRAAIGLFKRCLEIDDAVARRALLDDESIALPTVRARVKRLLERHEAPKSILDGFILEEEDLRAAHLVGETVGEFTITRLIEIGGMGTVYEARQENPDRVVALKIMHPGLADRGMLRRFRNEVQALARLRDPRIAHVFSSGVYDRGDGGVPYYTMELVEAARWITAYADDEVLDVRARVAMMIEVCEAVHHGHTHGVIHRDLKPANILVDGAGRVRVIDFGIARITDADVTRSQVTEAGQSPGTRAYMAPEQFSGDALAIDARCDVYALGVVLYELLCGALPYRISTSFEAARIIAEMEPRRPSLEAPSLRGDLETIILTALGKTAEERYASAAHLADDLRRFLRHEPIAASPPSPIRRIAKFARRRTRRVCCLPSRVRVGVSCGPRAPPSGCASRSTSAIPSSH